MFLTIEAAWVWTTIVLCTAITSLIIMQLYRNCTILRILCLTCVLLTDLCATLNTTRLYALIPEYAYISAFAACTPLYVLFTIIAFVKLGIQFYPDGHLWGEGRTRPLMVVCVAGFIFFAEGFYTCVMPLVLRRVPSNYFVHYCVCYAFAMVTGAAGAQYAFYPLLTARKQRETSIASEAYAVGLW